MSDADMAPVRGLPPSLRAAAGQLLWHFEGRPPGVRIGALVRMSAEWRAKYEPSAARGITFNSDGPTWHGWQGRVVRLYEREANRCAMQCERCASLPQKEIVAVVIHEEAECGCTAMRGKWCERCDNTFTATRKYVPIIDLEAVP
jgi:hypothetical protein